MALLAGCDEHKTWVSEGAIKDAAEALCKEGKVNEKAGEPKGKRPIMQVIARDNDNGGKLYIPLVWEGLPRPETIADLQLVVCIVEDDHWSSKCDYEVSGGGGGTYTIDLYKRSEKLTVLDAKTGTKLGEQDFEGEAPSDKCDTSIKQSAPGHTKVHGSAPSQKDETDFLRKFVEKT